jgi:hypothetical protein
VDGDLCLRHCRPGAQGLASARWHHRLESPRPSWRRDRERLLEHVRSHKLTGCVLCDHTVAAQQVAFDALRPGVTCADVDGAVLGYFEANGLLPYWRQHVGHGIGLRNHEAPFLDVGDHTPVEPGMVFTIEPGLYSSEIGGFRHSDTVAVTTDGIEILIDYPRDIESLTIDVA